MTCDVTSVSRQINSLLHLQRPDQSDANRCSIIRTPVRFKCVPENGTVAGQTCVATPAVPSPPHGENVTNRIKPTFVSTHYGDPGYCQLGGDCPAAIARGAEDESQPGVFHDLYEPQRAASLAARLREFTPADLQSAVIYADDLQPAQFGCGDHRYPRPQ
jgi:hypothetical protein